MLNSRRLKKTLYMDLEPNNTWKKRRTCSFAGSSISKIMGHWIKLSETQKDKDKQNPEKQVEKTSIYKVALIW